jgi:hypothetical protein
MKKFQLAFVFLFATAILVSSCGKDNTPPEITITSPTEGSTLAKGKIHNVTGRVTDDTGLSEIGLGGTSKITTFDSPTSHNLANITVSIPDTTKATQGNITITAKDVDGQTSSKTVTFKIQ